MEHGIKSYWWSGTEWREIAWPLWSPFLATKKADRQGLPGVGRGDHFFVVCVEGEDGSVANIIPHRYIVGANGKLKQVATGLTSAEQTDMNRIAPLTWEGEPLPEPDATRYSELQQKSWLYSVPPRPVGMALIAMLPNLSHAPGHAVRFFLAAMGISAPAGGAN